MRQEQRDAISRSLKGNSKLSEAMRRVHAARIADGSDAKIREKIRTTRIEKGDWTKTDTSAWAEYCKQVRWVTSKQPINLLENFDKRGRGDGKYHLDHIVSRKVGFDLGIPSWFIGDISNLRMIPEHDNCAKQQKTDENDLIRLWFSLTEVIDV